MTTVRTPATEIGITTRRKAPNRLHPSIIAASSKSPGIALKKPMRSQVQNGIVNVGRRGRATRASPETEHGDNPRQQDERVGGTGT
jgi:hypothetical protein